MVYLCNVKSPVGNIMLASDGDNLIGLWLEGQKYYARTIKGETDYKDLPIFEQTKKWLADYFKGNIPKTKLSLKPHGSEFQKRVWDMLEQIPYGKTITYGDIAKKIEKETGRNASAQAVGGAVGHNPISIIIPCHRVVGADGSLTGYAGGIDKKIKLLELEGVDMQNLYVPSKGTAL